MICTFRGKRYVKMTLNDSCIFFVNQIHILIVVLRSYSLKERLLVRKFSLGLVH